MINFRYEDDSPGGCYLARSREHPQVWSKESPASPSLRQSRDTAPAPRFFSKILFFVFLEEVLELQANF